MTDAGTDLEGAGDTHGAPQRVYLGIMHDLEVRRMVPGQRLVETDLAQRFGVGRNAVREAIQRLIVRGVVDPSRNRSPAIRQLDLAETHEILDVAAVLTGLAARTAAHAFDAALHTVALDLAMAGLEDVGAVAEPGQFSRARRQFYRTMLRIGGNRELQRLFPAIGMHIIYSQYQSPALQSVRISDYRAIRDALVANNADVAEQEARRHVEHVRSIVDLKSNPIAQGEGRG
jgi:DNA-binding GntR family transcriptional regulator